MSAANPHTPKLSLQTRLLIAADAQACPVTAALLREAAQAGLSSQKFGHVGQRKLDDLRQQGWVVNGVAITRAREDGGTERGAITYQGMVFWWWPGHDGAIAALEAALQDEREAHQQRIAELQSESVGYHAELAGYEHTIGHIDRIIAWQGELLKKVKSTLSVDDFGVPLESGENPLLDEITEHLEAVNTEPTAKTVEIDRIKPIMELYGWGVTGCLGVYRGDTAQQYAEDVERRLGGTSRAFALYREAK